MKRATAELEKAWADHHREKAWRKELAHRVEVLEEALGDIANAKMSGIDIWAENRLLRQMAADALDPS